MDAYVTRVVYMEKRYLYMEVIINNIGMKNAETTLDSLSILCLDGKIDETDGGI